MGTQEKNTSDQPERPAFTFCSCPHPGGLPQPPQYHRGGSACTPLHADLCPKKAAQLPGKPGWRPEKMKSCLQKETSRALSLALGLGVMKSRLHILLRHSWASLKSRAVRDCTCSLASAVLDTGHYLSFLWPRPGHVVSNHRRLPSPVPLPEAELLITAPTPFLLGQSLTP